MTEHCEKRQRYNPVFCGCLALLLLTVACQQAPPDTRTADQSAIKDLEAQWSKAAAAKNPDEMVSYYADDGSMLPPNMPIATGKQAVRAVWAEIMGNPGFSVSWQSSKVEASRSGDFAYDIGTYQLTMNDPQGKPMSDRGKYTVVWKKQPDGNWKAGADMFSSDLPLPAPPEKKRGRSFATLTASRCRGCGSRRIDPEPLRNDAVSDKTGWKGRSQQFRDSRWER